MKILVKEFNFSVYLIRFHILFILKGQRHFFKNVIILLKRMSSKLLITENLKINQFLILLQDTQYTM